MFRKEKSLSEMRENFIFVTLEKKNNKKQNSSSMYVDEIDYREGTPVVLINREKRGKKNTKRKEGNIKWVGDQRRLNTREQQSSSNIGTHTMKTNNEKKTKQKKHGAMALCATEGETWEKQIEQAKRRVICSELLRKGTKGEGRGG